MTKEEMLKAGYSKLIANPDKIYAQNPSIIEAAHTAMSEYAKKCVEDFGLYKLSREMRYERGEDPEYGNMSYQQLVDDFFKRYNR